MAEHTFILKNKKYISMAEYIFILKNKKIGKKRISNVKKYNLFRNQRHDINFHFSHLKFVNNFKFYVIDIIIIIFLLYLLAILIKNILFKIYKDIISF